METKGYKVLNKNLKCRGYQYVVGKRHKYDGVIELCQSGFHFYTNIRDLFISYRYSDNVVVAEVIARDRIIHGDDKSVTNDLEIVRVLSKEELLNLVNIGHDNVGIYNAGDQNTGNWNAGDWNAGDQNTGYRNAGDRNAGNWNAGSWNAGNHNAGNWNAGSWNAGDWNAGDRNAGNWNAGSWNTGYFNVDIPKTVRVFGKEILREEWERCYKPKFLYFGLTEWVPANNMTNDEKRKNPEWKTTGGYLRIMGYKEAFKKSWDEADPADRIKIKDIPGFDADMFYAISGIKVE